MVTHSLWRVCWSILGRRRPPAPLRQCFAPQEHPISLVQVARDREELPLLVGLGADGLEGNGAPDHHLSRVLAVPEPGSNPSGKPHQHQQDDSRDDAEDRSEAEGHGFFA